MPRRERNIYKRKDGRYEARYIEERDENGKAKYGAVYARTYVEVKAKRDQVKAKIQHTEILKLLPHTIVSELESYLQNIQTQVKESTYCLYQRYLEKYISPHFKNILCSQMSLKIMQGFVDRFLEDGLSVVTAQSVFGFLKNGFKYLPQDIFAVKLPKHIPQKVEVLSLEEQKRLESAAKDSDAINKISVLLCLYTGIRIGELCGLLWNDIDFERQLLRVERTVQRITKNGMTEKTKVICLTPKSATSKRSIPLPDFLIELLKEHRRNDADSYVITLNGGPIEPRTLQRRFKKLLVIANVRDVVFHVLRHSFSARALENGFDIKTLSEILGHSSATITLSKYAHVLDEHKRRNMESLGKLFQ